MLRYVRRKKGMGRERKREREKRKNRKTVRERA